MRVGTNRSGCPISTRAFCGEMWVSTRPTIRVLDPHPGEQSGCPISTRAFCGEMWVSPPPLTHTKKSPNLRGITCRHATILSNGGIAMSARSVSTRNAFCSDPSSHGRFCPAISANLPPSAHFPKTRSTNRQNRVERIFNHLRANPPTRNGGLRGKNTYHPPVLGN